MKYECPFIVTFIFLMGIQPSAAQTKMFQILSPDENTVLRVTSGERLAYSVTYKGKSILLSSELSIALTDGKVLGINNKVIKTTKRTVSQNVIPVYGMAASYKDNYTEFTLKFRNDYSVIFRVFDNGVAYRFRTTLPGSIKVKKEEINYHLTADSDAWLQTTESFQFSYEDQFFKRKISSLSGKQVASLPLVTESNGVKLAITEADLLDYPGYYLSYIGNNTLRGLSPKFVLEDTIGGHNNFNKISTLDADYIAETSGTRDFPWRLIILAEDDKDLLYNNLVYLLATENKINDTSWIKPGKVAWDWWNANNLSGVDFKSGFNTETYKYFIDFAARNKLEYIMMDEGWSDQFDLLKVNDGSVVTDGSTALSGSLDMPYLFDYAKQKDVGIILWCVWHTLDRQMTQALDQFEIWGVKGLKVDFMNRDDQTVVRFYERLAKEAAKRKMIIDFHAAYKPTGLERTYPNILNFEAVQGLEWNKFSDVDILTQATILPFTRMLAGPMDYTPGGLYNSNLVDYRKSFFRPMTLGTRCNQLAMFTMYYAPFEMLADSPTAYEKEPEVLDYLAEMPVIWDETIPLEGKIGDHAVIARRKGTTWHLAGLNNWTGKSVNINFDFLAEGDYQATIFADGVNANRIGSDYKKTNQKINKTSSLDLQMANGGGFAIKLEKIK